MACLATAFDVTSNTIRLIKFLLKNKNTTVILSDWPDQFCHFYVFIQGAVLYLGLCFLYNLFFFQLLVFNLLLTCENH